MKNANDREKLVLDKLAEVVEEIAPGSEVYLFGSRAKGRAQKNSDWDLLILLNQPSVSFELETGLMDAFYEVELETGEIIAPLIYSKSDWENRHPHTSLYENIEREGVKVT